MKKNEAEYGSRNIPLTTNLITLLISKLFRLSITAAKIIFSLKKKSKLKFFLILLQVFDISPKLNINHSTKTSSFHRNGTWFEGPCQDEKYRIQWRKTTATWLQRATRGKRYRVRLKSIPFLQNCKWNWTFWRSVLFTVFAFALVYLHGFINAWKGSI